MTSPRVLVFGVNETLLDLGALDPEFACVFGDANVRGIWFSQFIQNALISIVTDTYEPFGEIGSAALDQVPARMEVPLDAKDKAKIMGGMKALPPHPEVAGALQRLRAAGFCQCALTNSAQAAVDAHMANAGPASYFERILSADSLKRLKPARAPYEFAARAVGEKFQKFA